MSGICTFLFTDIEGSTRRWEADPEAMRVALAAHDEVLRGTIATHKGLIFKHTGDGVCAAFASPRSAVDAAVAAQRALEFVISVNCSPRRWPRCASRRVLYSSETLTMTR